MRIKKVEIILLDFLQSYIEYMKNNIQGDKTKLEDLVQNYALKIDNEYQKGNHDAN